MALTRPDVDLNHTKYSMQSEVAFITECFSLDPVKWREESKSKPALLRLKIDLVSHPASDTGSD